MRLRLERLTAHRPMAIAAPHLLRAAVLVAVCRAPAGDEILLTRRDRSLRFQPSDVCFPGGRIEADDPHAEAAALREAEEETGLSPALAECVARLDDVLVAGRYITTPVVAVVRPPVRLTPRPDEVRDLLWVSVRELRDQGVAAIAPDDAAPDGYRYHFDLSSAEVSGATARMLAQLLRLV